MPLSSIREHSSARWRESHLKEVGELELESLAGLLGLFESDQTFLRSQVSFRPVEVKTDEISSTAFEALKARLTAEESVVAAPKRVLNLRNIEC